MMIQNFISFINLKEYMTVPIGRAAYHGQTANIEKGDFVHYQLPRPPSSLGTTGKQGTTYFFYLIVLCI